MQLKNKTSIFYSKFCHLFTGR